MSKNTINLKRKSIAGRVYPLIIILAVLGFIILVSDISALTEISGNTTKLGVYLEMEDVEGKVNDYIQKVQLFSTLSYYNAGSDDISIVNAQLHVALDGLKECRETWVTTAKKTNDTELIKAVDNIAANLDTFIGLADGIAAAADSNDLDALLTYNSQIYGYIMPVVTAIEEYTEIFTAKSTKLQKYSDTKVRGTKIFDNGLIALLAAVVIIAIVSIRKTLILPAKQAANDVSYMISELESGNGDLTIRIKKKKNDEIGQLIDSINKFLEVLQGTINSIKNEAANMDYSVGKVKDGVAESNESAANISATMEEMSASIEEITATISNIATGSENILADVREMQEYIDNGAHLVRDINVRAGEMKENTEEQQKAVNNTVAKLRDELTIAVEESKKADSISDLTNDILSIASQTNLLALNASIEAARAGEAGKGFAVVADEIRQLADSSKTTANNIQEISADVIKAVHKLSEDAAEMLKFIDTDIIKDFDDFVTIVEQYKEDADSMDDIIKGINTNVIEVTQTVESMVTNMGDIATAMDENARGVTTAAESAVDMVNIMANIHTQAEGNEEISKRLESEVAKFKNV